MNKNLENSESAVVSSTVSGDKDNESSNEEQGLAKSANIAPTSKPSGVDSPIDDESTQLVSDEESIEVGKFEDLGLESTVLEAVKGIGWSAPTPVQAMCLPHTLHGRDVAGFAQTGTGKTGVFLITLANEITKLKKREPKSGAPLAIILVPTRELAVQIHSDAEEIFKATKISSLAVYGGVDYDKQAKVIRDGVDVIVATPGRLKDYKQKKILRLDRCLQFVCDEADRMFDMGFIEDVEFFLKHLAEETQKLLFSATTNEKVKELAFEYLEDPKYISVNPEVMTPERIDQKGIVCESTEKLAVLLGLFREHQPKCSIVFTNTKVVAEWVHYKLVNNGIEADLITGDLPQRKRISLIERIKAGKVKALIATDVASRGLHISDISHVYNFDLPGEAANYVHRIGRTARAGAEGSAYSLICEDYGENMFAIRDYLGEQVNIEIYPASEELLAVEDKALNPYKDPEFKGTTAATKPAKSDERPRGGRGDKNRQDGRRGGRGGQSQERGGRSNNSSRKGRPDKERVRKGGVKDSRKRKQGSPNSGNRDQNRKTSRVKQRVRHPEQAAAKKPQSTGIVKRFLKAIFGKK